MGKEFNNLSNLFFYLRSKEVNENILIALRYALSKRFNEKTVVNGKMLTQLFDNIGFAKAYRYLRYENLKRVFVSKNYAILQFNFKAKSWYSSDERAHFYIIGVNSETGKLWIEKVDTYPTDYETDFSELIFLSVNGKSLDLILTKDKEFQKYVLHYTYDLDLDGIDRHWIVKNNVIRVQGDIIMSINRIGDSAVYAYLNVLERNVASSILDIFQNIITRKIVDILQSYGLTVADNRSRILVPCIRANESSVEIFKKIYTIAKIVHDKLDLSSEFKELHIEPVVKYFNIENRRYTWSASRVAVIKFKWLDYDIVEITLDNANTRSFGVESYDSVEIEVKVSPVCCYSKAEYIVKKLRKEWVLGYVESKIRIGRHLVKATTKPLALNFELEIFGNKYLISVRDLPIVVYDKIEFIHPEHLKKTLTIPEPIEVAFTTIPDNEAFHERVNKYIMDYLVKKYGKEVKIEDEDEEESEI